MRYRNLRAPRGKLPEPLANALRMFSYNWQSRRSLNGTLWIIYKYGKPRARGNQWTLSSDAIPERVFQWLQHRESGDACADSWLLPKWE